MSDKINIAVARLGADAKDPVAGPGGFTAIVGVYDLRALLADHARLQEHGEEYREKIRDMYREQYALEERIKQLEAMGWTPPGVAPAIDLEQGLRDLYRAYVRLLESGRDRIRSLGGDCDPVDVMEQTDIDLRKVRDLLALIDGQAADPRIDLAADHTGMLVDYSGLIGSAQGALLDDPGIAEMLRQLCRHLEELGRRWYAGDRKVVDEFLQLYCIESEARAALVKQPTKGEEE